MSSNDMVSFSQKSRTSTTNHILFVVIGLGITQAITLCCLIGVLYNSSQAPANLVAINQDDEMVVKMARRYNLTEAVRQYDQVVYAIERYRKVYGDYPPDLEALIPDYLARVPRVYVRAGERLEYSPEPEHDGAAPFTFYIYGHHTGLQFMHGWELKYCPVELGFCGEPDDQHYHPHRINDHWIWVNRSAH
jgi:hypothetical protein